jgi:hypothetical protein
VAVGPNARTPKPLAQLKFGRQWSPDSVIEGWSAGKLFETCVFYAKPASNSS